MYMKFDYFVIAMMNKSQVVTHNGVAKSTVTCNRALPVPPK